MATIYIEGKPHLIQDGQNLLEACIELGLNVPYFCWHPALGSVGACRQCAVKQYRDENDKQGRIVMSCMTPATEGTRITVDDADSKDFRASVIEWMMTNHPHDCPVCDEGGECHLQDMTLMTGHNYRNYRFTKKTYTNQYLGPFVNHEMNRCIQCYRCVRYYKDYAGGTDLDAFAAHDHVYFGRHEDGVLENEFSGNLVEVCPTGVFTDKTLKSHFTRRWDYTTAPSICVHCGLGCNINPGERYGKLRRIRNRYNRSVNGYFLCDRGRYGYEFANSDLRPKSPMRRKNGEPTLVPIPRAEAMTELAELLCPDAKAIGIGSPRASLEANFALRALVGPRNFYLGISKADYRLLAAVLEVVIGGPARQPGLGALKEHDAVFILGEDLTNVAPIAALNVRQAVLNQPRKAAQKLGIPDWNDLAVRRVIDVERGPLFIATIAATKLDDIAAATYRESPDTIARLGHAVAKLIDPSLADVAGLSEELRAEAERIARALLSAEKPLIVSGPSCRSVEVIHAAANVAWALCRNGKPASIYYTANECNSVGLGLFGGGHIEHAAEVIAKGEADTLVVLENDLYRRVPSSMADQMLAKAKHVIVLDHRLHATTDKAEYVLPGATFAEGDGTVVNNIGRAQRMMQVFNPEGEITESWRWLRRLRAVSGRGKQDEWISFDDFLNALVSEIPAFSHILDAAPSAAFRVGGLKIPRQSHRFSGRTAMTAHVAVAEKGVAADPDSPLSFSMEGFSFMTPAALMSSFWTPGWNSAQSITRFQEEVNGPLEGGDPGIRLIEPIPESQFVYYMPPDNAPETNGELVALPIFHIFGSEELSALAPAVQEMAPEPYVMLHPNDAAAHGVANGDLAAILLGDLQWTAPVVVSPSIARGIAGLPSGLIGMPHPPLPARIELRKSLFAEKAAANVLAVAQEFAK